MNGGSHPSAMASILFSVSLASVFNLKLHAQFGELCFSYAFSFSSMLLDARFYFFLLMLLAHILISIFLSQHSSFLWFSQNICCLSLQINYHGGDYLTLIDSYCSAMLAEQLVWSSGYVMLLQFTGTGEAPERVRS